jgi:hypothetical protein
MGVGLVQPPTRKVEYHFSIPAGPNQGKIRIFFLKCGVPGDFLILIFKGGELGAVVY